jgi:hypothetical protein
MPRYADIDQFFENFLFPFNVVTEDIDPVLRGYIIGQMSTCLKESSNANVVEVVRCKDCKHYDDGICQLHSEEPDQYGGGFNMDMLENDFCSYGERKEKNDG